MLSLAPRFLHICTQSGQMWQIFMQMCRFTPADIPTDLNELNGMNLKAQALFVSF